MLSMENKTSSEPMTETVEPSEGKNPRRLTRGAFFGWVIDMAETILLALVMFVIINAVTSRVLVQNISMLPTLNPGELLLVNKLAYKLGDPRHGDIVVFHAPNNPGEDYIKRIIGVPGDQVNISNEQVVVNGVVLREPYLAQQPNYNGSWIVPEDKLFVLGDNRNASSDSHSWGFVPMSEVVGKALFVYWPLDKIGSLSQPDIVAASQ